MGALAGALAGCPAPARPTGPAGAAVPPYATTIAAAEQCTVRGVAVGGDGRVAIALGHRGAVTIAGTAVPDAGAATVTIALLAPPADAGGAPRAAWAWSAAGQPGPIAVAGDVVVAVVGATGNVDVDGTLVPVRGAPGALVVGLASGDGARRWSRPFGATEWVSVAAAAALPGGDVALAGSFAGTLRAGEHVVGSAGVSDGFVARVGGDGAVRWLLRVGGEGADAVTGVAALGDRVAVAGTFAGEADFLGLPLAPIKPNTPLADGFVGVLGGDGRPAWVRRFGGDADDQVAGVAVTASGRVAIAGTARSVVYLGGGGASVTAGGAEEWDGHGAGDGLVAVWDAAGTPIGSTLLGGSDYDGARAIAARGDELVVGGWFSGSIELAGRALRGGGGDGAYVAILDDAARVVRAVGLTGDGREDVPALGASVAGWAAGATFTAGATFDDAHLPAPPDPAGGCAVIFRAR